MTNMNNDSLIIMIYNPIIMTVYSASSHHVSITQLCIYELIRRYHIQDSSRARLYKSNISIVKCRNTDKQGRSLKQANNVTPYSIIIMRCSLTSTSIQRANTAHLMIHIACNNIWASSINLSFTSLKSFLTTSNIICVMLPYSTII